MKPITVRSIAFTALAISVGALAIVLLAWSTSGGCSRWNPMSCGPDPELLRSIK